MNKILLFFSLICFQFAVYAEPPKDQFKLPMVIFNLFTTELKKMDHLYRNREHYLNSVLNNINDPKGFELYLNNLKTKYKVSDSFFLNKNLPGVIEAFSKSLDASIDLKEIKFDEAKKVVISDIEKESNLALFLGDALARQKELLFIAVNKKAGDKSPYTPIEEQAILRNLKKQSHKLFANNAQQRLYLTLKDFTLSELLEFKRLLADEKYFMYLEDQVLLVERFFARSLNGEI
jgi:hypothetical protein